MQSKLWLLIVVGIPLEVLAQTEALFRSLPSEQTGISFSNIVTESSGWNYFIFPYMYNGGGVAAGDINNDGLCDLFFTANQLPDKLYLNKGNLQFEDITVQAGVGGSNEWTTGVSMIDINNDGWLDLYVCRSGMGDPEHRRNALFVNNGDLTFTERAKEFGLDHEGFSTQAYFLDYDRDGDLDVYLVNHRIDFDRKSIVSARPRYFLSDESSDRLFRNDGERFTDVTHQAGIANAAWGLSACIGDFNEDGWPDVYVANDFLLPDYLYINNRDGTFSEKANRHLRHITFNAMGSDFADINNDGLNDLFVLDMLPSNRERAMQLMASMNTEQFWLLVNGGHHYQYMLNTLQVNHGRGAFGEIAQLSGIAKTDWSWAGLFADLDNDGLKDLVVTNGIERDVTDNDFIIALEEETASQGGRFDFEDVVDMIPASKIANVFYRNTGNLKFADATLSWNVHQLTNSHGVATADLDMDGDLEVIINNSNTAATIYENLSTKEAIQLSLKGPPTNPFGIGAKVSVSTLHDEQYQVLYPSRGYLSSVEPVLHFGLGDESGADVEVVWPDGRVSEVVSLLAGSHVIDHAQAKPNNRLPRLSEMLFEEISSELELTWYHQENEFDDFEREPLIPHKQSENGPLLSVADVDGDSHEDFYIGGSKGHAGVLFIQTDSNFYPTGRELWHEDRAYEDAGSVFFDADGDRDLDLYVVSGGTEELTGSALYQDRLYINNGTGSFERVANALPEMHTSGSIVAAADYDNDGDLDLFVGGGCEPGRYPEASRSYLLENDDGTFSDVTTQIASGVEHCGIVRDAVFNDFDQDGDQDLIIVGEWTPIMVFENQGGIFTGRELDLGCTEGWWFSVTASDLDHDGDSDFVVGNLGLNSKFHPSENSPLKIYANDFDQSGTLDIVLAKAEGEDYFPVRGRECSGEQMPFILDKFPTYSAFASANLSMIYEDGLVSAVERQACTMASAILWNDDGKFTLEELPEQVQVSPLRGVAVLDINHDGMKDIVGAGNMHGAEVETVRYDASSGIVLVKGEGGFEAVPPFHSGFRASGDVRDVEPIQIGDGGQSAVLVSHNEGYVQVFRLKLSSKR